MFAHHFGIDRRYVEVRPPFDGGKWAESVISLVNRLGTSMLVGLVGNRGTGKTQAAAELGRWAFDIAVEESPREEIKWAARWTRATDFFASVRMKNLEGGESAAIRDWARPGLLVIDEAQERGDTEFEQRMIINLIDKRYGMMKDTLLISNLEPEEFGKAMGPSIMSRMEQCGGVIVCDWASFRTPSP